MQTPQYAKSPQTQSHQALRHIGTNYGIVLFNLVPIGDTGYIYMTSPNSSIEYSFEVVAHDLRYSPDMEKEKDFFSDIKDFEKYKEYNRFSLLKITGNTKSNRLSLMNLMDNGIKGAPQGALILSHNSYKELLEYIRSNFDK